MQFLILLYVVFCLTYGVSGTLQNRAFFKKIFIRSLVSNLSVGTFARQFVFGVLVTFINLFVNGLTF